VIFTLYGLGLAIYCYLYKSLFQQIAATLGFLIFLMLLVTYLKRGRNATVQNDKS
jgi:hypothetical protein